MKTFFKLLAPALILCVTRSLYAQVNPLLNRLNSYEYLVMKEENSAKEYKAPVYNKILGQLTACGLPQPTDRSVLYSTSFDQSKIITLVYSVINSSHTSGEISCSIKFVNYNYEVIASSFVKEEYQFLNEKNYLKTVQKCLSFLDGYHYKFEPPPAGQQLTIAEDKGNAAEQNEPLTAPEIILTTPKLTDIDFHTRSENLKVSGYVDSKSNITSLKINDEIVPCDEVGNFSVQLKLKEGMNRLIIFAVNEKKQTADKTFKIIKDASEEVVANAENKTDEITYRGSDPFKGTNVANVAKEIRAGRYYGLFIGIDNYSGVWTPLKNAVSDGKAVEEVLQAQYRFDVVKSLYDAQASRVNIISELEWLVANVKENDNVFIYYSGHGDFKKELDKGYWVPADAKSMSTSQFISNSEIQTFLAGIPSKHTLLVSDACFSGDIFRGTVSSIPFENSEKYYAKVYESKSRQAISSGGIEPVMDGGREGHSVFAYYLLNALKSNTGKYFDATQLFNKIKIPVVNNSEQSPNFNPIKNTGDEGGNFIFIKK
jgi:hypothetical protein